MSSPRRQPRPLPRVPRAVAILAPLAFIAPVGIGTALAASPARALALAQQPTPAASLAPDVAAQGLDTTLSFAEYDEFLVGRRALSEDGRKALKHLLRARLLDRLASESKLQIGREEVDARWRELEKEIVSGGQAASLQEYLRQQKVETSVFREFLRLAIVQETLSRRALGIADRAPVPADQQEMWLDQILETRGTELPLPPWKDGVAARCGDVAIPARDYLEHLRRQLSAEDVTEDCYQLLLAKRVRARMPDLAPEALAKAIDAELARRRAQVEADPRYKGLSFDQIMAAQGLQPSYLAKDPSVVASALAHVWIDRTQGPDGLRRTYESERGWFDGHFGTAVEAYALFLRAAVLTNSLIPRTFDVAEGELARLVPQIHTLEDFVRLARTRTEWTGTREKDGRIGWVAEGDEAVPPEIRAVLFTHKEGAEPIAGLAGPVRIQQGNQTGCALLWAGKRRPAPAWEEMSGIVHRELRRRFLEEVLPRSSVRTWMDAQ